MPAARRHRVEEEGKRKLPEITWQRLERRVVLAMCGKGGSFCFPAHLASILVRIRPLVFLSCLMAMADQEVQSIAACLGPRGFSGHRPAVSSVLRLLAANFTPVSN